MEQGHWTGIRQSMVPMIRHTASRTNTGWKGSFLFYSPGAVEDEEPVRPGRAAGSGMTYAFWNVCIMINGSPAVYEQDGALTPLR